MPTAEPRRRVGIYTGGELGSLQAKMAHGILRYVDDVEVVVDPLRAGGSVREFVAGCDKDIPIVPSVAQAVAAGITELVIGVAPPGGGTDDPWPALLQPALSAGVRVVNGLHTRLATLPEFHDCPPGLIVDLRHLHCPTTVARGRAAHVDKRIVLTVGSDCATGKMTTALELHLACTAQGLRSDFVPTGQTGMYIAGKGVAIDAVVSDFMSGAVEDLVVESADNHDYVFVEGQGSLTHPAYSGVSLGLLHGAAPDMLIFCHALGREKLEYFDQHIPDLRQQIDMVERLASVQKQSRVVAVSLSTHGHSPAEASRAIQRLEKELGLPVVDPFRSGCTRLVDLVVGP